MSRGKQKKEERSEVVRHRELLNTLIETVLALFVTPFADFFVLLATLCCSTDPESLYSKKMFRYKFGLNYNRANDLQNWIVKNTEEYAKNGYSIVAPLRVWYDALKRSEER